MNNEIIIQNKDLQSINIPQGMFLCVAIDADDLKRLSELDDEDKPLGVFIQADSIDKAWEQSQFNGLKRREVDKDTELFEVVICNNKEIKYFEILWG